MTKKQKTIILAVDIDRDGSGMNIDTSLGVADIERFGSTLLMDGGLPDGGRVLIWTD